MIQIYFCMLQKKNIFLELSSQVSALKKNNNYCFESSHFQFNG